MITWKNQQQDVITELEDNMGYKTPDLKEDIKDALAEYLNDNGYRDWHWRNRSERMEEISEIIDKHFEKIER